VAYVTSLIDAAIADGVPADKIILGGFSQGGGAWQMLLATS
jgi:predicted esterase